MPSLVTHHHFAVMTAERAEPDIAAACNASPCAYRWGVQGPDILYYHNVPFGSRIALLGRRMHRERIASAFNAMVRSAARLKDPAALSYLMGFCTHYSLDRRTHPFVQYMIDHRLRAQYPAFDGAACHRLCEADLDGQVIRQYISSDPESFEAHRLLDLQSAVSRVIGRILSDTGAPVYGIDITTGHAEASMRSIRLVHTLLHGGSAEQARAPLASLEKLIGMPGILTTMLRPREPLPEDCANEAHTPWFKPHIPDVVRRESFFDLMEAAVPSALSLQRAVYDSYHKGTALNPLFFPSDYSGIPLVDDNML